MRVRAARPRRLRHGRRLGEPPVASASMRERAVFIGLISVWDTIGTLPVSHFEIITLFRPAYCRVMGRKAPRKRLACRVISAFTRVL